MCNGNFITGPYWNEACNVGNQGTELAVFMNLNMKGINLLSDSMGTNEDRINQDDTKTLQHGKIEVNLTNEDLKQSSSEVLEKRFRVTF